MYYALCVDYRYTRRLQSVLEESQHAPIFMEFVIFYLFTLHQEKTLKLLEVNTFPSSFGSGGS